MTKSDQIAELAGALAKAQGEIKSALKDSSNPFFKSKYADLTSVWTACRDALSKNNLSLVQMTTTRDNQIGVETMLLHSSGQWITETLFLPVVKFDPQGIGSAITYARRYGLAAMVGVVADDDDDGEKAMGREEPKAAPKVVIPNAVKQKFLEQVPLLLSNGDELGLRQIWDEFSNDEKIVMWGLLNSQQRKTWKDIMP